MVGLCPTDDEDVGINTLQCMVCTLSLCDSSIDLLRISVLAVIEPGSDTSDVCMARGNFAFRFIVISYMVADGYVTLSHRRRTKGIVQNPAEIWVNAYIMWGIGPSYFLCRFICYWYMKKVHLVGNNIRWTEFGSPLRSVEVASS